MFHPSTTSITVIFYYYIYIPYYFGRYTPEYSFGGYSNYYSVIIDYKNLILFGAFTSFQDNARSIKHLNSICLPPNLLCVVLVMY